MRNEGGGGVLLEETRTLISVSPKRLKQEPTHGWFDSRQPKRGLLCIGSRQNNDHGLSVIQINETAILLLL